MQEGVVKLKNRSNERFSLSLEGSAFHRWQLYYVSMQEAVEQMLQPQPPVYCQLLLRCPMITKDELEIDMRFEGLQPCRNSSLHAFACSIK